MANNTIYPYGTGGQMPSGIPLVNDLTTGGADKALSAEMGKSIGIKNEEYNKSDFCIADESGNEIVRFSGGHIITKNFNSNTFVSIDGRTLILG